MAPLPRPSTAELKESTPMYTTAHIEARLKELSEKNAELAAWVDSLLARQQSSKPTTPVIVQDDLDRLFESREE